MTYIARILFDESSMTYVVEIRAEGEVGPEPDLKSGAGFSDLEAARWALQASGFEPAHDHPPNNARDWQWRKTEAETPAPTAGPCIEDWPRTGSDLSTPEPNRAAGAHRVLPFSNQTNDLKKGVDDCDEI